jgi:hypothetical protein
VVYTGELNDVELTKTWGEFSGVNSTSALWRIAQKEGREAKFLTAQEAVNTMTLKEGFKVNVWASEPLMTQPMAFCWDDRGRLWIAENRDYESRGMDFPMQAIAGYLFWRTPMVMEWLIAGKFSWKGLLFLLLLPLVLMGYLLARHPTYYLYQTATEMIKRICRILKSA